MVCVMFWRYEKTKIPSATAANSLTSEPGIARVAAKVSMPRASNLGTSRLSPLPAMVRPTMAATSGRYGVRSAVSLGPAGRAGFLAASGAWGFGSATDPLVYRGVALYARLTASDDRFGDGVHVGQPPALRLECPGGVLHCIVGGRLPASAAKSLAMALSARPPKR